MLIDPEDLRGAPDRLEDIEKASLRMVTQAVCDFHESATTIFEQEEDLVADIGEDITREALDSLGMSRIDERLFGKMDYKRARYVFHPEYAVKQALFVDSKAEDVAGQGTATLQTAQTSMRILQSRAGQPVDEQGKLPCVIRRGREGFLTTTIFVKYNYATEDGKNRLVSVTLAAVPNGMLQERYNPSPDDGIWLAGRNAPTRGEPFRVRVSFHRLKRKQPWRVQRIFLAPYRFRWEG